MSHRNQLLAAAEKCLQTRGYARTTARDLVAESGTNLASIGYHFGSKEALLNEAIGEGFKRWIARQHEVLAETAGEPPVERLRKSVAAQTENIQADRALAVAFVEAMAQVERSEDLRRQMSKLFRESIAGVAELLEELLGPVAADVDTRVLASLMIAISDGLMLQQLLDPKRTPTPTEVHGAVEKGLGVMVRELSRAQR